MRQCAIAIATALVLAMITPAFAQPFADTPTNHWAYDAIAELAAKGLIEGYPDGTFKGDRAMTRYEMAMVVARLLARIESIQIPAPTPAAPRPEVGRSDVDTILRLVNEFRAELAAKNVRLTAVEEELNALKARLDNVKIRGRYRLRYDSVSQGNPSGGPAINGNANTGTVDASKLPLIFRARQGLKLMMEGSVSPDTRVILGLELASNDTSTPERFNSSSFGLSSNSASASAPQNTLQSIAELFFDWKNIWGTPIELWAGRFGGGVQGFGMYPVQFGPFGFLLNTGGDTWGASTNNSGVQEADGLRLAGHWPELADLQVQGVIIRVNGPTGGSSYNLGEDAYGVDANIQIMPGLRAGAYYVANTTNTANTQTQASNTFTCPVVACPAVPAGSINALWHVYGNPDTNSLSPQTALCPAVATGAPTVAGGTVVGSPSAVPGTPVLSAASSVIQGGIECAAAGSGWGGYVGWDIIPGVHLDGEYAQWNDSVHSINDSAFWANVTWDLATLLGTGHNFSLQTAYAYEGTNFYPPYGTSFDTGIDLGLYPGNFQGFTGIVSYDLFDNLNLAGQYITGNFVSNGQTATEWLFGFTYKFAPGTAVWVYVDEISIAGIAQSYTYRAQMQYVF